MLEVGQYLQMGRYRILERLNQGGMGAVYLATDRNLAERQVAIKENIDASAETQEQFLREAVMLARLTHPNLPRVTDHFIEANGRQYLVMDYVGGDDLRQIVHKRGGPLPEFEALEIIEEVMVALDYMHSWVDSETGVPNPIVHRDIKPSNIKRTTDGRVVLVDFGLAKYQTGVETQIGARAVTPGYSPVEQYTGGTDVRSDIYSLGATLYLLLTGERPPDSPVLASGATLPSPRQRNPTISRNTERVLLRALQLHAADRFQSVQEMHAALTGRPFSGLGGERRTATRPLFNRRGAVAQKNSSRTRLWIGVLLLIGMVAVAGSVLPILWQRWGQTMTLTLDDPPTPEATALPSTGITTTPQRGTEAAVRAAAEISATVLSSATVPATNVQNSTTISLPTATVSSTESATPSATPATVIWTATPTLPPASATPAAAASSTLAVAALAASTTPTTTESQSAAPTLIPLATPTELAPTATATHLPTATATATTTATPSPTETALPTATTTATTTATATASPAPTNTATTATNTPTATATSAPTATATAPPTNTATTAPTATGTPTSAPLPTATPTATFSPTTTPQPTATDTPPPTSTPLPTATPTATFSPTVTPQPTATDTPPPTSTPLPTATPTATFSPTTTPQPTATDTHTPAPTDTPLPTTTVTATDRPTLTPTGTPTPSPVATATSTPRPTATRTRTPTNTPAPTHTATPGRPQAGATRINPADNATYLFVPAGPFTMGSTDRPDEMPVHTVELDDFWIMQTEVTNRQYARCVEAGQCTAPNNERWRDPAYADHPVVNIDWNQANGYASWAGGRLPTEAEWEKAARGTDARAYPWGDGIDDQQLNYNFNNADTVAVGQYSAGASPFGLLDMAGNVEEWVADWHAPGYDATAPRLNPGGPESGVQRVVRGGSFHSNRSGVRTTARGKALPNSDFPSVGLRVVIADR